jgi:DNA-binding protein HU-beta
MTKKELIAELAEEMHMTRAHAERVLNKTLAIIQAEVKSGHNVKLSGFGTFYRGSKAATQAAHPRSGKKIDIPQQVMPKFRAGTKFKRLVK